MKILLFGEYSGLFNSLKDGLINLGHDVFLVSNGDYHKNYPSDYRYDMYFKGKIGNAVSLINVFTHLKLFSGFDVVLIISVNPLFKQSISKVFIEYLIHNNKKVFISGAGLNTYSFNFWSNSFNSKYNEYTKLDYEGAPHKYAFPFKVNKSRLGIEKKIFDNINGYIPIMYEYSEPYRDYNNLIKTIPIPINLSKFEYKPNFVNKKIVFFHGITRACKGGKYILEAFDLLSKKYSKEAEFIAKGGLPFNEYMELIERTNVILDDANAYSLGMNGLFSMAKGKIVMGGAEPVANAELGYEYCPAINLTSNVKSIINSVENIIERKMELEQIGYLSRRFVEEYHDYNKVAQEYVNVFETY